MENNKLEGQNVFISDFIFAYHFFLESHSLASVSRFLELLMKKNEVMNLTSAKNLTDLCESHLRDSLELFHALPPEIQDQDGLQVLDIGSGGGFPGITTAIVKQSWKLVLLESITKKANFLSEVVENLQLMNTTVKNCRAETFLKEDTFQKFDIVMARAVGKIDYLYPLFKYFVKPNGLMVFWKKMDEVEPFLKKYPMKRQKKHLYEVVDGKKSILIFSL